MLRISLGLAVTTVVVACSDADAPTPAPRAIPAEYAVVFSGGIASDSVEEVRERLPYDSITLARQACFGTCPVYRVTLYKSGHARYHGEAFVTRLGHHTGDVDIFDYARLSYMLDQLEFMRLEKDYVASWTDAPTATVTVGRRPGGVHTVRDYGEIGPIELWTMRQAIDAVSNRIQWSPDSLPPPAT